MELRERNYRSRFAKTRGSKARYEAAEDNASRPKTPRENFTLTNRHQRKEIDSSQIVKRWAPWVIGAAIVYYLVATYLF
jgi:hypothetical protein